MEQEADQRGSNKGVIFKHAEHCRSIYGHKSMGQLSCLKVQQVLKLVALRIKVYDLQDRNLDRREGKKKAEKGRNEWKELYS